ncbi:retrovirus-related pol polyprotein from transposon TNT 1-94 [Tanacetum coccineum]
MFDESLNPPPYVDLHAPEVIAPIPEAVAPEHAVSTGSPSSTTVDQDAPSPSNSHTTQETQTPIISHDVEEDNHDIEVAHMGNDPYFGIPIPEVTSDQSSSSDVIHTIVPPDHQVSEHNSKWTKDHPLENIIIEPKNYKDALTQACWIEAMQEELHEFERLEVWELVPPPDKVFVISLNEAYKVKLDELGDPVDTPLVREVPKLDEDKEGKYEDPSHNRGMIGTLLYLPPTLHIADHAGCPNTLRSTSGITNLWVIDLVSRPRQKGRKALSISITEAENIALFVYSWNLNSVSDRLWKISLIFFKIAQKSVIRSWKEPPLEKEILSFLASLGHFGESKEYSQTLMSINASSLEINLQLSINKCLSGKPSNDSLRLSQAQILWGMYNKKKVDYASSSVGVTSCLPYENKNTKKGNAMYKPRLLS